MRLSASLGQWSVAALLCGAAAVLGLGSVCAQVSDVPVEETAVTNGAVYAIARSADRVYIAGDFTYVGGYTGCGVPLDAATGQAVASYPKVNDTVDACTPDGAGGWFVGGAFTQIGGQARSHIAHLLADGSLDLAWNPGVNDRVRTLAVSGSILYLGGDFTQVGGQSRLRAAALDTSSGLATAWDPAPNDEVDCLAVSDAVVYAGGLFTSIGRTTRTCIAALETSSGLATAWDPHATSSVGPTFDLPAPPCQVLALATSGTTVYAGGFFDGIGATTRTYVAALDASTGLATAWDPHSNGTVRSLALTSGTLYAAGSFSSIGGQARRGLAALDVLAGACTGWSPNVQLIAYAVVVSGSTVCAGVVLADSGTAPRLGIVAITGATGQDVAWEIEANDQPNCLAVSGSSVYAGGYFSSLGGERRLHVASLNAATGQPTTWNAGGTEFGFVRALAVSGSTVYVGGYFDTMGGRPRNSVAALDSATGLAADWNPVGILYVTSLEVSGSTVYVGTSTNDIFLVALDAATGEVQSSLSPNPDGSVFGLAVSGSTLYIGGGFGRIARVARSGIAALDTRTGLATAWRPDAHYGSPQQPGFPTRFAFSGSTVYAAGFFDEIGGQQRVNVAALDATTGLATDWDAHESSEGENHGVAVAGPTVYVLGRFHTIGGQPRTNVAALNAATGLATDWDPGADGQGRALLVSGSTVYIGGDLQHVGGQRRHYFAQFRDPAHRVVEFRTDGTAGASIAGAAWQSVDLGADCSAVTAVAPAGHHFLKWTKDGADYSTANPLAVTNVTEDAVVVAVFAPVPVLPVGPAWVIIQ